MKTLLLCLCGEIEYSSRSLILCVCFVDRCLSFYNCFWPLCCLSFDIRILITPFGFFKLLSFVKASSVWPVHCGSTRPSTTNLVSKFIELTALYFFLLHGYTGLLHLVINFNVGEFTSDIYFTFWMHEWVSYSFLTHRERYHFFSHTMAKSSYISKGWWWWLLCTSCGIL